MTNRRASGYRQYDPSMVQRIEIADLLALKAETPTHCSAVEKEATAVIIRIDQKVAGLTRMREALGRLVDTCHSNERISGCPLLEVLASGPGPRS